MSSNQDVGSFTSGLEPARIKPYGRVAQGQTEFLSGFSKTSLSSQFTKERINPGNTLLLLQGPCVTLVHVQKNSAISSYPRDWLVEGRSPLWFGVVQGYVDYILHYIQSLQKQMSFFVNLCVSDQILLIVLWQFILKLRVLM